MTRALASLRGADPGLRCDRVRRAARRVPGMFAALLVVAGAPLLATDASVLSADGTRVQGAVASDGRVLTVGNATLPLDRLLIARFANGVARNVDQGVVLADGDVVAGMVLSVQGGQLALASDRFGARSLPLTAVAGLVLAPQPITALARIGDEPAGGRFLNGDRLTGTLAFLNPATAGINNGKRIVELPRERLVLVRTATDISTSSSSIQRMRLITGERLSGQVMGIAGSTLTLRHPSLGDLAIPLALIVSLWSDGGALTPLTSLPASVVQAGFLGSAPLPRPDGAGNDGPLPVTGGIAEQVLRVQARCDLTYNLDGASDALVAEVALDPRATGRGDATVRVLGDGKLLTEIALADGATHVLNVPLASVRTLVLQTTAGPDGVTTGDLVTWSWPMLVRNTPTAAR